MSKPLVSIMIPVFNQEKYVANAIESALNQDYENIEIVIGDDCSEDNTEQIIKPFLSHPQVKYFKNSLRLGRVKNYHTLLYEKATGEWVVNLDGDDCFTDTTFISSSIELILSFNNKEIVFLQAGHTIGFTNGNKEIIKLPNISTEHKILNGKEYLLNFIKINHFSHLATLYKREIAINMDFYTANILSTDMDSLLRLAIFGKVILLKKPVGVWLQHGSNASSSSGFDKLIDNLKWIDNVSNFLSLHTNDKKIWNNWRNFHYKVQLTGIFMHEAKTRNRKEIYKLLNHYWKSYKFLFVYPVFIKKTIELLIKNKNTD